MKTTREFDHSFCIRSQSRIILDTFEPHGFEEGSSREVEILRLIFVGNQPKDNVIARVKGQRERKNGKKEILTEREIVFQLTQLPNGTIVPAITLETLASLGDLRPRYAGQVIDASAELIKSCLENDREHIARVDATNQALKLCAIREFVANKLQDLDATLSKKELTPATFGPARCTSCDNSVPSRGQTCTQCMRQALNQL